MKMKYSKLIYYIVGCIVSVFVLFMLIAKSDAKLLSQGDVYYVVIGIIIGVFVKKAIDFFVTFYKEMPNHNKSK